MTTFGTLENHVVHHHEKARKWALVSVHLSALSFVIALAVLPFFDVQVTQAMVTVTALFVVAMSLFLFVTNTLYGRMENSLAEQVTATTSNQDAGRNLSNTLETIGRLTGGVAHDFNNSLLVLLNCIEMMRTADEKKVRQGLLVDMEIAARGAQSTAARLISLSREGQATGEPSDPRATLRSTASNLRRMFPENILVRDYLRGTPSVALESGQLEQVVMNICLNARDAMVDGGELTLRCYEDPLEQVVIVEVEDTATPDRRSRPTTLYNAQCVVEAGGRMVTRVLENRGTSTILMLPIAARCAEVTAEFEASASSDELTALLVDDNELVLTMLNARLEEAGYKVFTADSVEHAVTQLSRQDFDVLVCDAMLPDGTPNLVVKQFRKSSTGPVVICSGYSRTDPLLAGLCTESAVFLQKPFSTDELLSKLCSEPQAA